MGTLTFANLYIERCDKETENFLSEEGQSFLEKSINYLMINKNEFVYFEGSPFHELGIDGLSFEVDDVFGTYNVMLGLKLQKKREGEMKAYLNEELSGDGIKYSLLFDQNDGLWNVNFTLNYVQGFAEDMSFLEGFTLIYHFLVKFIESVK